MSNLPNKRLKGGDQLSCYDYNPLKSLYKGADVILNISRM